MRTPGERPAGVSAWRLGRRLTNLLLLLVVGLLTATGLVAWLLPEGAALPLYDLHRFLGATLLLLLGAKYGIAAGSLRRRLRAPPIRPGGGGPSRPDRSWLIGLAAALALLLCLGLGLAWTLDLVSFDSLLGYSPLNLHVYLGLLLGGLMLLHAARRWERRPRLGRLVTRREALRLGLLAVAGVVGWRVVEVAAEWQAEPGGRRPTGSKHAGSHSGNAFPVTNWLLDAVPPLDAATWQVEIGRPGETVRRLGFAELAALPRRELTAILDCTGGWWSEQRWQGYAVADVLRTVDRPPAGAGTGLVRVVSVTGHAHVFPLDELRGALLATHVGGETLAPGHGYPVRLVVPGRRGFQWIKWVGRIELL